MLRNCLRTPVHCSCRTGAQLAEDGEPEAVIGVAPIEASRQRAPCCSGCGVNAVEFDRCRSGLMRACQCREAGEVDIVVCHAECSRGIIRHGHHMLQPDVWTHEDRAQGSAGISSNSDPVVPAIAIRQMLVGDYTGCGEWQAPGLPNRRQRLRLRPLRSRVPVPPAVRGRSLPPVRAAGRPARRASRALPL